MLIKIIKQLPIPKRVIFVLVFIVIFTYTYRKSEKKGSVRWIDSVKFSALLALVILGLIPSIAHESRTVGSSSSSQIERVIVIDSEEQAQILDLQYLNSRKLPRNFSQALILSRKITSLNESPDEIESVVSQMLNIRGGDLSDWKFSPGSRARGAAVANSTKTSGTNAGGSFFVEGFTPLNPYRYQHRHPTPVKTQPNSFQPGNGGNDGNGGNFSDFKGGPSPYQGKFNYDNQNHRRDNVEFVDKRVDHSYDRHAKDCYGMQGNRNKQTKQEFVERTQSHIQSPETIRINGSYRYADPAYHYVQNDLVVTVNATNNQFISVRNATIQQLENLKIDGNLGLDTRPDMILRLRGPNSTSY